MDRFNGRVDSEDFDGLASLPRQVEGVIIGATVDGRVPYTSQDFGQNGRADKRRKRVRPVRRRRSRQSRRLYHRGQYRVCESKGCAVLKRLKAMTEINGVICINKPQDFTSFDVVAIMRRAAGTRKIGHGGTLDPMATGVLPIYIGRAAKTADLNPVSDKRYRATFRLGVTTDTEDVWGKVLTKSEKPVTHAEITDAVKTMQGDIMQIPPMYSAVKINGKRLYDLARQGIEVERAARPVTVYSIELSDYDEEKRTGTLDIYCSKSGPISALS